MKKKKHQGHYCKVCGTYRANEKFSGKGHANHICRTCSALPVDRRNELIRINRIFKIGRHAFIPKHKLELLRKYADDKHYPEAAQYAEDILGRFYAPENDLE
ncbi:MAG: hypothetical protein LBD35_00905 [Prevotellaceae bacterium]|jgi:hypothetical protein|nr:hypothetical protein [Prevotellaceae bacterium]